MLLYYWQVTYFTDSSKIILGVFFGLLIALMIYIAFRIIEMSYVMRYKKPFYIHLPIWMRSLSHNQRAILHNQFAFYSKLLPRQQRYFEHRVAAFMKDKRFVGRESLLVTDEMKVLISATAVMLTFGFRDFYIGLIDRIFIYPNIFYSVGNGSFHKGEFNPKLRTLVLSWKHFRRGFEIETDKVNLGIHEFAHAIHLNSIKERDVSSTIFSDSFQELTDLLTKEEELRKELVSSNYFRDYAYTNQFEFLAVLIESFIEKPKEFKEQFPQVYSKTKQMLNFNFAGY
ncbi:zinc-dependent peptidase [Aegicerativicinus sediminis]|uniref:zinc-dependent peptidase n=1 Tax=Aegicerativicinus sediminis TaxID=2893202 RepID=UPI001E35ED5F|nr:zinc-dependent peptidase [Aegicerativicinus sediminis]